MFRVRKEFKFCYAHQLFNSYTTLCHETIHGHNARVEIFLESEVLDDTGMVIDFGEIKDNLKDYIDNKLDHALFMPKAFPEKYLNMLRNNNVRFYITDENPTAEIFARMIFEYILNNIPMHGLKIAMVRFWETDSSYAEYTESEAFPGYE